MDIRQLRALLAVAETGSATKAAEMLRIVQPAVSRHIRLLEEEFGVELFGRERHGMVLTEAGKTLAEYGRRALQELDRARAEIRPASGAISGTASIGLLPSTCELLAAELVASVKHKHPALVVRLTVGYAGNLMQWLEAGDVETALLYDPKSGPGIHIEPLLDERLYLVGPPARSPWTTCTMWPRCKTCRSSCRTRRMACARWWSTRAPSPASPRPSQWKPTR